MVKNVKLAFWREMSEFRKKLYFDILIFSPFFRLLGAKNCKNLEKQIFVMDRLTITKKIFEKKKLSKVSKLVVAADSTNLKKNHTVSTCEKLKVVNLRFFFCNFFHFFFNF